MKRLRALKSTYVCRVVKTEAQEEEELGRKRERDGRDS